MSRNNENSGSLTKDKKKDKKKKIITVTAVFWKNFKRMFQRTQTDYF